MRIHISEGSVSSIRCPQPDCRGEVAPRVVRQVASEEEFQRWKKFEVQKILSNLPGIAFCPRCESNGKETPVLPASTADDEAESAAAPLMTCDQCDYIFCGACREAYHPSSRCVAQIHRLEKLGFNLQSQLSEKETSRKQRLAEELASLRAILADTVPCPKCKMPVSRTQGCNHMICAACTTHFCYRCGADITQVGYDHFRADKCPTFDREEVERFRGVGGYAEEDIEAELEELRQQYPDQANIVWNFRPPPGAWRRHARVRQNADTACPKCRQWNPRQGTNNHIKCRCCKSNFCAYCRKAIEGPVTHHFSRTSQCPQHSE